MHLDHQALTTDWRGAYRLFLGFVNPRPIALISTVSRDGRRNLAPFSFYNMVCANPPIVMFSAGVTRHGGFKHTFQNAADTGEFVVATVHEPIARQMVDCAADLPADRSEFDFSGLTPTPATVVRASLVREALVNIECRVRQVVSFGDHPGASRVVFGDVVAATIDDAILNPARDAIDPHKLRTIGRLGEAYYATVTAPFAMKIPDV